MFIIIKSYIPRTQLFLNSIWYLGLDITFQSSAVTLFKDEVLPSQKAVADQRGMLEQKLSKLFADQRFSRSGSCGVRGVIPHSTKKSHWRNHNERWERRQGGHNKHNYQKININFNPSQLKSNKLSGNAKEKGLNVTLDDLVV